MNLPDIPIPTPKEVPDDFQCIRCGACCEWPGYVHVTESEIEAIAEFVALDFDEFMERYVRLTRNRDGLSLVEREDNQHCIFYCANPPRCIIQEVKPQQCRNFPYQWRFNGWETACGAMREREENNAR